jgi:hypothetical protein
VGRAAAIPTDDFASSSARGHSSCFWRCSRVGREDGGATQVSYSSYE